MAFLSGLTSSSTARYEATQVGSKINAVQKEIGMKKRVGLTRRDTVEDVDGHD